MQNETVDECLARWAKNGSNIGASEYSPEGLMLIAISKILAAQKCPDFITDITRFQEKYQQAYNGEPRSLPEQLDWRAKHLNEELTEYLDAVVEKNIAKQADALTDLLFLVLGTMYVQGFPIPDCWKAVFESNMTKVYVAKGGKFGAGVHKGENYKAPDWSFLTKKQEQIQP